MKYLIVLLLTACASKPHYHVEGYADPAVTYECMADDKVILKCDGSVDASECTYYCESMEKQ